MKKGFTPHLFMNNIIRLLKKIKSIFNNKKGKGFTLLEVLIYLGVALIIISVVLSFIFWLINSNTKNRIIRETTGAAKRATDIIIYETKKANSVYTPTITIDHLSLETHDYLPEQETISYIDFYICGDSLCMKKESQDPIRIIPDNMKVIDLSFTYILSGEAESIKINLTIGYKNLSGRPEYETSVSLESSISLRLY